MFKNFFLINCFVIFFACFSYAEIVKDITVSGNKRLSKESIIVFGNIQINKDYNQKKLNFIFKDLFSTNFFKDIKLEIKNSVLIISVIENPIIEELEINGISNEKLTKILTDIIELKSRKSYIETIFLKDLNLIKNTIKSSGYYFAEIKTSLIKNEEQNSVRLIYDIDLGDKAKISEINFIGDKKIKDRKLRNVITTEESKFWKFISNKIYLDSKRIELDKRLLAGYYKDKGYYNVIIENSYVEFKDNGSFKLIFKIDAGNKFTFNKLDLVLPVDYEPKYFEPINNLLTKYESQLYSSSKIKNILKEIDKIALSKKYEFIDASITENIINGNKLDIIISIIETQKLYVEKINILGNSFTLEEVIRHSFIVDEGDPYNEILFNKSINMLKSKNIFATVNSKITEGSSPDLKVIDLTVVEKPTGEISLGAGIGTSGGSIGGGIKENNFLGKGISLNTNITFSEDSVKGKFVYTKPNFNNTDNTLFTSVNSTTTDRTTDYGYKTSNLGFSLGTSFQQYENLYFAPTIATTYEKLTTSSTASSSLKKQKGDYLDIYFNYSLNYDLRDKTYKPTDGYRTIFYQELPLLSENSEIMNSFEYIKYQALKSEMVGRFAFNAKAINAITDEVRISKRLYIPANKLRGFELGKIGPMENNDYIGGNYISTMNLSTSLPKVLPSFQNTDISLFFDAANMWGVDYNSSIDNSEIRSSVGLAIDFFTPIGPLNFSLAQPITKSPTDKTETFRFNLGTTF